MDNSSSTGIGQPQDGGCSVPAKPVTYRGIRFRSTLEANWAATFDDLGWTWQYEPIAVILLLIREFYLPDFYLPDQRVWCEVKGPHGVRTDKTAAFAAVYGANQGEEGSGYDAFDLSRPLVVLLEASGPGGGMRFRAAHPDAHIVLAHCGQCARWAFLNYNGLWACRYGCRNGGENKFWRLPTSHGLRESGEGPFVRIPWPPVGPT